MSEKKKSETTDLEKIILGTGAIQFMTNALESVRMDYQYLVYSNPKDEIMRKSLADHTDRLRKTMVQVRKAAEDLANYLNNRDIVDDELLYATAASFNLMYERPVPEKE